MYKPRPSQSGREPIIPVWKKRHEISGDWIFGLTAPDLARVEAGYACSRCLEPFETLVEKCPVCGEPNVQLVGSVARELLVVVPTPEGW